VGLEPTRRCHRGILSPLRLPVPPRPRVDCLSFLLSPLQCVSKDSLGVSKIVENLFTRRSRHQLNVRAKATAPKDEVHWRGLRGPRHDRRLAVGGYSLAERRSQSPRSGGAPPSSLEAADTLCGLLELVIMIAARSGNTFGAGEEPGTAAQAFGIVRICRRGLVWINVTKSSTGRGLRASDHGGLCWDGAPGYMIRDRDRIHDGLVTCRLRAMGIRDKLAVISFKLDKDVGRTRPAAHVAYSRNTATKRSTWPTAITEISIGSRCFCLLS
jgi:hypothetical protein